MIRLKPHIAAGLFGILCLPVFLVFFLQEPEIPAPPPEEYEAKMPEGYRAVPTPDKATRDAMDRVEKNRAESHAQGQADHADLVLRAKDFLKTNGNSKEARQKLMQKALEKFPDHRPPENLPHETQQELKNYIANPDPVADE